MMKFFNNRKFKYGTMATAFTAVFIALILLLNFGVTVLVEKNPLRIDITDNALFSFTEETVNYLENLEQEIEITVLAKEEEFIAYGDETSQLYYQYGIDVLSHMPKVNEMIKRYSQYSSNITVDYIDILEDPNFVSKYPNDQLAQGQIIVSSKDTGRHKIINAFDLFYINNEDYSVYLNAEKILTSAIMVTAIDDLVKVQYTTGHNEGDVSGVVSLLEQNAYESSQINLSTDDINQDTDLLVIMAPLVDFSKEELDKIDLFLENNGQFNKHVVYFAAYNRADTPLLDSFLKEWGILISTDTVVETDTSKYYNRNPFMNVPVYSDEVLASKYSALSIPLMTPYSVPLSVLFEKSDNRETQSLLKFTSTAVAMPRDVTEDWKPEDATKKGPFDAAITGSRITYSGLTELRSSVTVFGSFLVADSSILGSSLYANAEYLLDVFNSVTENEIKVNILIKNLGTEAMNMTSAAQNIIFAIFVVIVPVCVLIAGIAIWILRRNK